MNQSPFRSPPTLLPHVSVLLTSLLWAVLALPAPAEERKVLQLHGFGGWSFGDSDGNEYLFATEGGEYETVNFALNLSAHPLERLSLHAQVEWHSAGDEEESELDYAFADWKLGDQTSLRIGKVKQPFGYYAEIFDVGTARPFLFLPQGIYGPAGNVAEGFFGAGLTGAHYGDGGWGLEYDVYLGALQLPFDESFEVVVGEEEGELGEEGEENGEEGEETEDIEDVLGGRLILTTPIDGLRVGVSAFTGREEEAVEGEDGEQLTVFGGLVEYLREPWTVVAEYTRLREDDRELTNDAAYLEVAYRLHPNWQVAARYDWSEGEFEELDISPAPTLLEHEDLAVAVSYWFSPELTLKLEYHQVEGNRFALPGEELEEVIEEGELESETSVLLLGVNFSF